MTNENVENNTSNIDEKETGDMTNENVPPAPTVVIGVGEAGIKAMAALHDLVKGEGEQDYFKFVAIESNREDLRRNTPEEIQERIYLETPAARIDLDKSNCAYLYPRVDILGEGAARQRVVGRYLIDNRENYQQVYNTLSGIINGFAERHQNILTNRAGLSMNIWLLHSLGGGTGSGTFPLLAALIQEIKKSVRRNRGIDFFVGGAGCLPSMVRNPGLEELGGDPRYYANAFAAMRELEKILQCSSENPLKINMYSRDTSIDMEQSPFDKYFLIGINEDALTATREEWIETYIEQKNNLIANCIYSLHKYRSGLENWPPGYGAMILGTFGERELGVPIKLIKAYVKSKDECSELKDKIERNGEELKEKKEELEKLKDVVLDPYDIPDKIKTTVDARMNKDVLDQDLSDKSEAAEKFCRNVKAESPEGAVYAVESLKMHFKETRYQALWESKVNNLWNQYSMKGRGDEYQTAQSVVEKYGLLIRFIEGRIREDEGWIKNPPTLYKHIPGVERGHRERLSESRRMKTELQGAKGNSDRIIDLKRTISELESEITDEVGREISTLEAAIKVTKVTKSKNEDNLRSEESDCSSIESDLSTSRFGRVGFLEMNDLHNLTASRLESMKSFNDFVTNGFVERDDVNRALETQAERAKEWSDLTESVIVEEAITPLGESFILYHPENESLVTDLPVAVRQHLGKLNQHTMADQYMIKICTYKLGIDLQNISDYKKLWDYYNKGELADLVGMGEEPIGEIFAYPEFFPDDENVKAVFKKIPVDTGSKSAEQPKKEGNPQSHIATKKITDSGRLLVDGSNVAWESKKDGKPNIDNIEIIRLGLEKEGYNNPIILVDANLRHKISEGDKERFKAWIDEGKVIQSPAQIKADETILKFADEDEEELKIVSNDIFKGYEKQYPWLNDPSRRVPFKIIDNRAILHFR